MSYKEVQAQGDKWDHLTQDTIEGVLVEKQVEVGTHKSKVYVVEVEDHELVSVWGKTILDKKMEGVAVGSQIKITYTGEIPTRNGKALNFRVWVDDGVEGVSVEDDLDKLLA